ncbi:hypothetical protein BGZ99_000557, partial [Dissophora globulifera]
AQEEKTVVVETVVVSSTDEVVVKETLKSEESTATEQKQQQEGGETGEPAVVEVATIKRRIDELEDQATRDRKRFRGLVTVAVGLAAVAALPQVLPYFS